MIRTVLTTAGAWIAGCLILALVASRSIEAPWQFVVAGLWSGAVVGVVGTLLSATCLRGGGWPLNGERVYVALGLLPPLTASLFLAFGKGEPSPGTAEHLGHAEALATSIGAGIGEALVSGVLTMVGFGLGAAVAVTGAWFLWNRVEPGFSWQRRCVASVIWLAAISIGIVVFYGRSG